MAERVAADPADPAARPSTPLAWRIVALGLLFGGLAIGAAGAGGGGARWLVLASMVLVVIGLAPVVVASRRPPVPPVALAAASDVELPIVTVVIAARDEAPVLPRLIADLGAQDHREPNGRPRFEIILIDDRSSDGSAAAVATAADPLGLAPVLTVVRRDGPGL
ncbi:MAG: glycosyltransferase, partial [Chloroflexi bacterium]|nr:glycosyltransferase [Chloroflexota bacterium]